MPTIDRRAQILGAAERLFSNNGPRRTTIADVARACGIAVGSVYLEFPSKDAIAYALSALRLGAVFAEMRAVAEDPHIGFAQRLTGVFDARTIAFFRAESAGAHVRDMVSCTLPATEPAKARFCSEQHALVAALLRGGARAGEISAPNPEARATATIACYAAFAPPLLDHEGKEAAFAELGEVHRIVLGGLVIRPRKAP